MQSEAEKDGRGRIGGKWGDGGMMVGCNDAKRDVS